MQRRDKQTYIHKEFIYTIYTCKEWDRERERDRKGEGPQNVHELARFT